MRLFFIFTIQILTFLSCIGQTTAIADTVPVKNNEENGIVYFSADNGNTWKNASDGIPGNAKIGLGGVTASGKLLALATKENGVFIYNIRKSIWEKIPTEQRIIDGNIGAIIHYKNSFYVGTQSKGIFLSGDNGKSWEIRNTGLGNLTIRRFFTFENKLYVCTNDGFYLLDEKTGSWKLEYGETGLQVNGATIFQTSIYIATNKGIYSRDINQPWKNVLPNHSVHNISSDREQLYGMTYTALLLSSKDGAHWQNIQNGLPEGLYTFNVLRQNEIVFAGQWDGIYRRNPNGTKWELSSNGLPSNFAVTNLKASNNILVISTSERKLKKGVTTKK